jgi:hypothetical protein
MIDEEESKQKIEKIYQLYKNDLDRCERLNFLQRILEEEGLCDELIQEGNYNKKRFDPCVGEYD